MGDHDEVALVNGGHAKVDPEDVPKLLAMGTWRGKIRNGRTAACGARGKARNQYMHRVILGLAVGDRAEVDHINGNALDNRKENLRVCTHRQNMANRRPQSSSASGFRGVYLNHLGTRWNAEISFNGKKHHLGCFPTALAAAKAYNDAARELHGHFARPNELGSANG